VSTDLAVYLGGPPSSGDLEALVRALPQACTLDGPLRVDLDDLPDAVAAATLGATTLLELSLPAAASRGDVDRATRAARTLVDRAGGALYDPQSDAVLHPRTSQRRLSSRRERRGPIIRCAWFVRRRDLDPGLPGAVLRVLRRRFPEAMPRRFGSFEPLQERFEESGPDGFTAAWRAEDLHWSGTRPCLGAGMAFLTADCAYAPGPTEPTGYISLDVEAQPAFENPAWADAVCSLLLRLAEESAAFYAHAEVVRNVLISDRSIAHDNLTERTDGLVPRTVWRGLPSYPVWVAWFGPAYARTLGDVIPLVPTSDGAAWLRNGVTPCDRDAASIAAPPEWRASPWPGGPKRLARLMPRDLVRRQGE